MSASYLLLGSLLCALASVLNMAWMYNQLTKKHKALLSAMMSESVENRRADDNEVELEACRQALANTNAELRRVREQLESMP